MKKTLLLAFFLSSIQGFCQQALPSASPVTQNMGGGSATISTDFIVDWSIGESACIETFYGVNSFANAIVGINWNVTSGLLQPFDKVHIIYNYLLPNWTSQEIRLYPVPTQKIVYIDFRSVTTGKITIQLFSHDGKILGAKEFNHVNGNSTQSWDLSTRVPGIYNFRILLSSDKGQILKQGTFKVEKN